MAKLFSFCVRGGARNQCQGMIENLKAIQQQFPNFETWIYTAPDVPAEYISMFRDAGGKVIPTPDTGMGFAFHRFSAADDPAVEVMFSRSCTSRIHRRDAWAINEFLTSDKKFHIIRDHVLQTERIPPVTFGIKRGALAETMAAMSAEYLAKRATDDKQTEAGGPEKDFLERVVYPRVKGDCLLHTNILRYEEEVAHPIPPPVTGADDENDFVGNVVEFDGDREVLVFDYWGSFRERAVDHLALLRGQKAWDITLRICSALRLLDFGEWARYRILDDWYIAAFYAGGDAECQKILALFSLARVNEHIIENSNHLLVRFRERGFKIVGTCDPHREPHESEIVVSYGNYHHSRDNLPWSQKLFRHAVYSPNVHHDYFESAPCWAGVGRIYVINLEERRDRLLEVMVELARMRAPLERVHRFEAVKPAHDNKKFAATVGCSSSHIGVVKDFLARGDCDSCLVLEDDFTFTSRASHHRNCLKTFFDRKYDYDVCLIADSIYGDIEPYDDLLNLSFQPTTTASGYILSRAGAEKLLPVLEEGLRGFIATCNGDKYAADCYWSTIQKDRKFFVFKDKFGYQRPGYSSITCASQCYFY